MPINWTNSWRDGAPACWPYRVRVIDRCFMHTSFQTSATAPSRASGLIARFSKTPQGCERRPRPAREILAARIRGEAHMPGTVSTTLSRLFVIDLGIAFGAGLYEHRIVVPRWLSFLRRSLSEHSFSRRQVIR